MGKNVNTPRGLGGGINTPSFLHCNNFLFIRKISLRVIIQRSLSSLFSLSVWYPCNTRVRRSQQRRPPCSSSKNNPNGSHKEKGRQSNHHRGRNLQSPHHRSPHYCLPRANPRPNHRSRYASPSLQGPRPAQDKNKAAMINQDTEFTEDDETQPEQEDEYTQTALNLKALEREKANLTAQLATQQQAITQAKKLAEAKRKLARMQSEVQKAYGHKMRVR